MNSRRECEKKVNLLLVDNQARDSIQKLFTSHRRSESSVQRQLFNSHAAGDDGNHGT